MPTHARLPTHDDPYAVRFLGGEVDDLEGVRRARVTRLVEDARELDEPPAPPSAPSKRPPPSTVSMCEPVTSAGQLMRLPTREPTSVPDAITARDSRLAASICERSHAARLLVGRRRRRAACRRDRAFVEEPRERLEIGPEAVSLYPRREGCVVLAHRVGRLICR